MRKNILVFILLTLTAVPVMAQTDLSKVRMTRREANLASGINKLRKQNGLSELKLSVSLTYVAQQHVSDLQRNRPDTSVCSTASWSDKGNWSPCCYSKYVLKESCMWDKPKELTDYLYKGYELSYYSEDVIKASELLNLWRQSPEAMDMILNQGRYQNNRWSVIGLCIGKHYACVWFGQFPDKQGAPAIK